MVVDVDMDEDLLSEEISVSNVSEFLQNALDSSIRWPLLNELSERLEGIGGNSKEMMKVNRWFKEQLEAIRTHGATGVDGLKRSQIVSNLLEVIDAKESLRQRTLDEIVLRSAPLVEAGRLELKKGAETSNKVLMSFEVVSEVPVYKCETASSDVVERCINEKIIRFANLFKGYCQSKDIPCDIKPIKNYSDSETTAYGRIGAEGDVPLDQLNATIQGTTVFDYGVKAQITNIHALDDVCLFPGQMAAITGRCFEDEFGVRYVASKIRCGIPTEPQMATAHSNQKFNSENLHISVVRGCLLTDELEPVNFGHVFNKIKRDKPHVVFLMGPFVSVRQVAANGEGLSRLGDITFIYKRFFNELSLLATIPQLHKTYFVLVPHCYDVISGFPLPQPPFNCENSLLEDVKYSENIVFLSNPGYIRINGILFGVTSCDPVSGIANNMICIPNEKRTERVCKQLLHQRSFFPGYPASALPAEYAVDHAMLRHLEFAEDAVPDVFIFSNSTDKEPFVEFAGGRAFVGCHGGGIPKDALLEACTDIYIAPYDGENAAIQPLDIESRLSLALALWRA